jgi:uncharacterized SAM-binding protein YcdF (DUF218 family)
LSSQLPQRADHSRAGRRLAAGAAVVAVGLGFGSHAGTALVVSAPLAAPDAIVSLASHEWERLPAAAEWATRYPTALVLLTVPQVINEFNCHDCAHRPARLKAAGVDASRVRLLPLTEGGTYGEAVAVRAFAERHHLSRVLVVTSPYHTRRGLATFSTVLSPAHVAAGVVPATATSPARPDQWWTAPYDRAYVRYEWAAIAYYAVRHGVPPL